MGLVVHACEKLQRHYRLVVEGCGQQSQNGRANIKGRDGPRGSCARKALHRQMFIVGCLQVVDRRHRPAAVCSTGYGAAARAVRGWDRNTPKEWFREAIRKLPRRWQPYINWERNVFSWQLFTSQPKVNKTAAVGW